jgi:hypothetical protein
LFGVLSAIYFDYQLQAMARKIDNVMAKAYLPPEVRSSERQAVTQIPPKLSFGLGRFRTHGARPRFVDGHNVATA